MDIQAGGGVKGTLLAAGLTLCQLLSNPSYNPPPCLNNVCVLTGLGGIVTQWTMHVDRNHGALFLVEGVCASACFNALQYAMSKGETVRVVQGVQLIPHEKSPLEGP